MTLLPTESWNVKARPDLPAYELNDVDPINGERATEDHHLWRRSFGKDFREAWWVELEDGTVVPNRLALSHDVHRAVTDNEIRIVYTEHERARGFYWHWTSDPIDSAMLINPQPGPRGALEGAPRSASPDADQGATEPMQTTIDGEEVTHRHVVNQRGVEKPCTKCKGTGKVVEVEKPKGDQPQAPARPKTTWSCRVPKDEREDGYELLTALMEAAVERAIALELVRDANTGANYYVLLAALRKFVVGETE